jgi:hypothetical protein
MSVFQKKIGRPEFLPVFLLVLCSMLARCYAREHRLGWSYARAGPFSFLSLVFPPEFSKKLQNKNPDGASLVGSGGWTGPSLRVALRRNRMCTVYEIFIA